ERASFGAARLRVSPLERFDTTLEHQQTLEGPKNDQTTLGARYRVHPALALEASGTTGTQGQSAQGGAVLSLGGGRIYLKERVAEDRAGRSSSTVLGSETAVGPAGKVYSEYQWGHDPAGDRSLALLGTRWQKEIRKGLGATLSGEYSEADSAPGKVSRYTLAAGLSFADPRGIRASTHGEIREEDGAVRRVQLLTTNRLELALSPGFTLLARYRFSETKNRTLGTVEAGFEERTVGLAWRPVREDRLNALAKYTQLFDRRAASPTDNTLLENRRDVFSVEWSLELNRHLEWVTKEAVRLGKDSDMGWGTFSSRTWLSVNRLNVHVWKTIDLGIEYRILHQEETDTRRQGWLTELMWNVAEHMRVGVGYNFTDFSDNELSENDYSVHGAFVRVQGTY
ncbi:MAG TPA: hypothetical protein VIS30_03405, partial [Candidatus Deferrimicrobiaceae bacterium]